jgi:DNA-binding MarR family transcriptional regulator
VHNSVYYDAVQLIERLHRRFLDVMKVELERRGIQDINNIQALILYNIGDDELTVGELTLRGYYLGSNVSYNVKKMVENDYLIQARSVHDKRSIRVRLSDKGLKLKEFITDLLDRHEETLASTDLSDEKFKELTQTLRMLERFWTSQTNFTGLDSLDSFD